MKPRPVKINIYYVRQRKIDTNSRLLNLSAHPFLPFYRTNKFLKKSNLFKPSKLTIKLNNELKKHLHLSGITFC